MSGDSGCDSATGAEMRIGSVESAAAMRDLMKIIARGKKRRDGVLRR